MIKIDLGCGRSKKEGFIGIDSINLPNVDIVHNLNQFPYPFSNDEIDEIVMDNVLEHLDNPILVIEELYRISKNNAKITVSVPYYRSVYAYIDPTHKNFFSSYWFSYFDPNHNFFKKYSYTNINLVVKKIEFDKEFLNSKISFFHKLLIFLAQKYRNFYETRVSHFYPLNSITFTLKVTK
ncbi:class I SAM-dependent methyltransferase [Silvanigrella sp.]|jgi:predicted SAM-dependent methyltransferase|uniref:class I SAM-dependent methyltransferase n=1 Tax=Silvanigrella sp. TaxID=2024976 RepID=UPI0037C946CB|nr:class I SAM-dependent methyltransferase [Silvanigrellaceae bacterium]